LKRCQLQANFINENLTLVMVIQVLNPKLGITLRVSVTSATILADVTETRNVISFLFGIQNLYDHYKS